MNPEIDFSKFDILGEDITPLFNDLANKPAVHWNESSQVWVAGHHDAVVEGFSGKLPLSAERHLIAIGVFPEEEHAIKAANIAKYFPHFVTNVEPPEHSRLRKLLMAAFSKRIAEGYREVVREIVGRTVEQLGNATQIDFVAQFARPVTVSTILHVMGLSPDFYADTERWARALNEGLAGVPDPERIQKADKAIGEMAGRFVPVIRERRASGSQVRDFLGELILAGEDGDRLSDEEIAAQMMLVIVAGHDTTLNTMALTIAKLSRHQEVAEYMRRNPDNFEQCIMELMRVVNMSTLMSRIVTADFTWHGQDLKAGQIVFLLIAGANRDPSVFAQPDKIDLDRSNQARNMTFAPGRHFCIGHWFAKMIMSEALPAFMGRFESWQVPVERLEFSNSIGFRGLVTLPLQLTPMRVEAW
ncbi:cytochrome P450 [Sphingobium sp. JS3065]|uniref:cytochrome P450 n=1 Tax=Sphingobium sp. JS3065 TaxID=2970925 RepID=UPI00226440F0|nr:cytochrome P450 [Sphingobium sp. JS3065]UZW57515.1 cytochrome P450 [Sphingobium sp. JS3065]